MSERANFSRDCDLVAIGGGTGGLVTAAGAAYLGLKPALVEKSALGGDCLWTGCVPSKALIASARLARNIDYASTLGLQSDGARSEFRAVMERMRAARATVAHHDDPERFRKMGVSVHFGAARFLDASTVEVEGIGEIRSKRFVIATGAVPAIPPIPGLDEVGYWTYETVFDQNELPGSVAILGGGPIGLEFAQVFARLGSRVTVIEMTPTILIQEDPDVAAFMHRLLTAEGIEIRVGTMATAVRKEGNATVVDTSDGASVTAERVFVATGRRPMTDSLNLEAAGIRTEGGAVVVDSRLQTSSGSAWAVGDVTGAMQFTHVAEQMAKVALRNAVIPGSTKIRYDSVPWVTYTDPEIAHVGMSEAEAEAEGGTTYRYELDDLDRAIVDASAVGFVKVSADRRGRVLGATIVAHGGGELILPLVMVSPCCLAMTRGR
ncbi:MAG: FAD-dependent oxidoreductase, partial [Gemmatimonadetes bacterium]|nr:FAD-dependent oxidoreductase [Gemmatimonadota bacterium]